MFDPAYDDPGDSTLSLDDNEATLYVTLAGDLNKPGEKYDPDLDPNSGSKSPDWALKVLAVALGTTVEELKAQGARVVE